MHTKQARAAGETEQRLFGLSAWTEAPFYTDGERAALRWAECVTLVADTHVPDDAYAEICEFFDAGELVDLTMAIIAINAWNRLAVGFRSAPALDDKA